MLCMVSIARGTVLAVSGATHDAAGSNESSAALSLTAAFACTGTVAVRMAGTGVLSALALGGASATCSSSKGCMTVCAGGRSRHS